MASIAASSADGRRSSWSASTVMTSATSSTTTPASCAAASTMTIFCSATSSHASAAQARREVVDGDDLAAQADDAADPVHGRRDRARLGVADDLVDVGDRERVLLVAQAEDDELARDGFLGHDSVIGPEASQLESERQVERMASAMMSTRQRRTVATISSALSATTSLVPLVSVEHDVGMTLDRRDEIRVDVEGLVGRAKAVKSDHDGLRGPRWSLRCGAGGPPPPAPQLQLLRS